MIQTDNDVIVLEANPGGLPVASQLSGQLDVLVLQIKKRQDLGTCDHRGGAALVSWRSRDTVETGAIVRGLPSVALGNDERNRKRCTVGSVIQEWRASRSLALHLWPNGGKPDHGVVGLSGLIAQSLFVPAHRFLPAVPAQDR